ncbi:type II toxin-antitoxin system RelE/ParE family toxin [Flavobacterium alvei]|uniref:type II toxin-antitoxin system RelE/ParE family toxin n=1 Tax=Flavobacterium alvei TaxID=2080416 RepID=UPI0026F04CFD|nr:type II toxin-antitoxin system RelE/ParE family toxin [Flavobacterium alvei]
MKIRFTVKFKFLLEDQVRYISKDKPLAAKKFKKELLSNLKKDLKNPFHFKESIYSDGDKTIRDYVFKGYTVVFKVDNEIEIVSVVAILKHRNSF